MFVLAREFDVVAAVIVVKVLVAVSPMFAGLVMDGAIVLLVVTVPVASAT